MIPSENDSPIDIIRWAISRYPELVMTSGLNISGAVLLDLAANAGFSGEVLFVDTGFHFPETLEYWDNLRQTYTAIKFIKLSPVADKGFLFQSDPVQCCQINKVTPLETYLKELSPEALLNARTRDSSSSRKSLEIVEQGIPLKINPLITWTRKDLESYIENNGLRLHPLYKQGYLSMGCWPCTQAVKPGHNARSGRFIGQSRTECGIWGSIGSITAQSNS